MLRRSFLALMGAAIAAPLVSPLEAFTPGSVPVLAVEATVPYWLLELQEYERFMAEHADARQWAGGKFCCRVRDVPKLPVRPLGDRENR